MSTRFSKKLLVGIFAFTALFIVAVLVVFWHTGLEPATLIVSVFGVVATELGALAAVRGSKEKTIREGMKDE